jgi:hypothetical protein
MMARQTINIGSSPNKGDGDPVRVAFDKVNSNFEELYASVPIGGTFTGDVIGSVFAEDSSILVDALNNTLYGRFEGNVEGDITGSVFADDSTVLVDAVNGVIPGYVSLAELQTAFANASDLTELKNNIAGL